MKLRENSALYDHLEYRSFAELFELKHRNEDRLQHLSRKEPGRCSRDPAAYSMWIGRNVECIAHLNQLQNEIRRRKELADTPFRFDGRALQL